jgi:hypothetical protein
MNAWLTVELNQLRARSSLLHTSTSFLAPLVGFIAVMTSMILFYAVNASIEVDTLQSWSCRWENVVTSTAPHFGQLCKESKTALYLSVILVPVQALVLSLAVYQTVLERKVDAVDEVTKRASPALS